MTINRHICFITIILLGGRGKLVEWPPDAGCWPCGLSLLGGCRGKQKSWRHLCLAGHVSWWNVRACFTVCAPEETVTAALTPSSFVGPRHQGRRAKGTTYCCSHTQSVPVGASLQGAHVTSFVLNVLCLEHRLTSEPASSASIKTCRSPSLKMLRRTRQAPWTLMREFRPLAFPSNPCLSPDKEASCARYQQPRRNAGIPWLPRWIQLIWAPRFFPVGWRPLGVTWQKSLLSRLHKTAPRGLLQPPSPAPTPCVFCRRITWFLSLPHTIQGQPPTSFPRNVPSTLHVFILNLVIKLNTWPHSGTNCSFMRATCSKESWTLPRQNK